LRRLGRRRIAPSIEDSEILDLSVKFGERNNPPNSFLFAADDRVPAEGQIDAARATVSA
jgi:hypothetical protein